MFSDIAIIQENGYGQIVGRIKDMVIRGGENLYPREIEEVLIRHKDIAEAYVVGVPDERMGEELCAWLKFSLSCGQKDDSTSIIEEIKEFCKQELAHFKIPKYFLVVDDFPTTVTGKIQKFKMRDESINKLRLLQ